MAAVEHGLQIVDSGAVVAHLHHERLRPGLQVEAEPHGAAAGVIERVAGDLRHRAGDAGLIEWRETEAGGDHACLAARDRHLFLGIERNELYLDGHARMDRFVSLGIALVRRPGSSA